MSTINWAVLTACIWGIVPLLEKMGLAKVNPLAGLFYRSLGVTLGLLIMGVFILKPLEIRSVGLRPAILLMTGGFLASFAAQLFFYHSLKGGEISRVVPIAGSYPLISFILGILLLGESVSVPKIAAAVLIITGIWLLRLG